MPEEDIMTSSMCEDVMTSSMDYRGFMAGGVGSDFQDSSLYDHHKSQSSSEELLSSTPGSNQRLMLQKSASSSEELLSSTPGSRSGSLERILENRSASAVTATTTAASAIIMDKRSRSSSRDRSLSGSSPLKSSLEQKTPDTENSDTCLPPPPPALLEDLPLPPPPPQPAIVKPQPKPRSPPKELTTAPPPAPPSDNIMNNGRPDLPLGHLRDSLRKTKTYPGNSGSRRSRDLEDGIQGQQGDGTAEQSVAPLDSSNVKQVISRYGTIPKGARIGQFLASLETDEKNNSIKEMLESPVKSPELEQRFRDKSRLVDNRDTVSLSNYPQMPTPEVKRKVEEWRAGVERSMIEQHEKPKVLYEKPKYTRPMHNNDTSPDHNVKPSSVLRSNSTHAIPAAAAAATTATSTPEKTYLTRQKSDLTGIKSSPVTNNSQMSSPVTDSTMTSDTSTTKAASSPQTEWQRRPKPTPSPRVQHRFMTAAAVSSPDDDVVMSSSPPKMRHSPVVGAEDEANVNFHKKLAQKLSPPVPKKVLGGDQRAETPPPTKPVKPRSDRLDSTPSGDSSMDSSTDSLLDTHKQKPARSSFSEKIGFLRKKDKDKDKDKDDDKKHKKEKKSFFKQGSSDKVEKSSDKFKAAEKVYAKPSPKVPAKSQQQSSQEDNSAASSSVPVFGGRSMFPGGKPMLPGGASASAAVISSPKQLQRMSLHHVDIERDKDQDEDDTPVSKETLLSLSQSLKISLDNLNSRKSKHTSNFMHLSEEVQTFYNACSSYVEGLPPHGKFHFRELLTTLENIAESLKTCSGSNAKDYDRLLTELTNSINEINNGVSKR